MELSEMDGKNMRNGRVKMTQANLDRIQKINEEIVRLDNQRIAGGISLSTIGEIGDTIKKLEDERDVLEKEQLIEDQAAEQAEHEQKAQEVNGSNSEIAIAILDAVFPDATALQAKIGLTEFGTIRTDLLQLFDGALTDRTATLQQKYAEEMAQRDEKVRLVQKQTNEVRQQLDASEAKVLTLESNVSHWIDCYNETSAENTKLTEDIREAKVLLSNAVGEIEKNKAVAVENESLKQQITELEQKLKVAQQPKADAQLSQSFTDRMNEIKTKNEARIKSSLELSTEGALGFRGKVLPSIEVPDVSQQESPFQPNEVTESNDGNVQGLDAESTPVEAPTFQITPPNLGNIGLPVAISAPSDSGEGDQTPATRGYVDARIAQVIAELRGEKVA